MKNITFKRLLNKVLKEDFEAKAEEVKEKLYGKQSRLDKNKNGRLDAEDFRMLRKSKKHEVDESDMYDETTFNEPGSSFDYVEEGNLCECGGEMREGECMECGMKEGTIYEIEVSTDEVDEEETLYEIEVSTDEMEEGFLGNIFSKKDEELESMMQEADDLAAETGKPHYVMAGSYGRYVTDNPSGKSGEQIYSTEEFEEDEDTTLYEVQIDENFKNNSVLFTENQLIDLIEEIAKKDKTNIKKGKTHPGLASYEKVHKASGKEENDYMTSFVKKIKDSLKGGSKGTFETNPKHFPKGNGQLEKMSAKKYTMSDAGNEFLDSYMRPGMQDLVPDEIEYDEKWVNDNVKGSSRTGNNPEWANAEKTDLGDKIAKRMKDKKFRKAKLTAYRKSKQPITDGTGENSGSGLNIKTESISNKEEKILNEEFFRIKDLMSYDRKTQ